jgi:sortase A
MAPRSKARLGLEVGAWCVGLLCVSALIATQVEAREAQHTAQGIGVRPALQSTRPSGAGVASEPPAAAPDLSTFQGVIGRLDVPALGLHVPILNDYDPESLRRGVGRMKGAAVPGGLGNLVLAGHRDTYFRPLRRVQKGMLMRVVTPAETFDYVVDSTTIVTPDNVDVLDIGDRPEMTLITCYPFDYIGAAPKRFIVRAHLVSLAGETP